MKNTVFWSASIYTGISVLAAVSFMVATLTGDYTAVERIGGTLWVFILSMIILMPLVTQAVKKRTAGE